jgi:hypothetical protein
MTCKRAAGLIEAGPFVDALPGEREAAVKHARECATCGAALQLFQELDSALPALPVLAAPPHLADAVLARLASLDENVTAAASDEPAPRTSFPAAAWPATMTIGSLAATTSFLLVPVDPSGLFRAPAACALAAGLLLYGTAFLSPAPRRAVRSSDPKGGAYFPSS